MSVIINIEFRVWDEVEKKMIYSVDNEFTEDGIIFWYNKKSSDKDIDFKMLYSTLKDDCNLKIYDGDIVKIHNERESMTPYLSLVTVDIANGTTVMPHPNLQKLGDTEPKLLSKYISKEKHISCFVIGNMCRNPELLDKIDKELNEIIEKHENENNTSQYQQEQLTKKEKENTKEREVKAKRVNNKPNIRAEQY